MKRILGLAALPVLLLSLSLCGAGRAEELPAASGDKLAISVQGEADFTKSYTVDKDGYITLPLVGKIAVKGMSPAQIRDDLSTKLKKFVKDPQITVEFGERAQISINVTGAVKKPGTGMVARGKHLLDALAFAEGEALEADLQKVKLHRKGEPEARLIDVKKLRSGDASLNIELQDGDTITVPFIPMSFIRVTGAVHKPTEWKGGETVTLIEAIAGAGDPTADADIKKVQVLRKGASAPETYDYEPIRSGKVPAPVLHDGDTVSVPEFPKVQVNVLGYVAKGGPIELRAGCTVLDAITAAGGWVQDADKRQVKVIESTGVERTLNLAEVTSPDAKYVLSPGAKINVPQEPIRKYAVGGGVNKPGTFSFPSDPAQKVYLTDALASAEGTVVRAKKKTIAIVRKDNPAAKPRVLLVDLEAYLGGKQSKHRKPEKADQEFDLTGNPELQIGDVVVVDINPDPREKRPGIVEKILGIAGSFAGI